MKKSKKYYKNTKKIINKKEEIEWIIENIFLIDKNKYIYRINITVSSTLQKEDYGGISS